MDRGVVLEVKGKRAVVLVSGGEFRQIRLDGRQMHVGQEIEVPRADARTFWPVLRPRLAVLMALMLIAVLVPFGYLEFLAPRPALASVCIDINPTVELGIDARGVVVSARGIGDEGQAMLQGIEWQGKQVEDLIVELLKLATDNGIVQKDADLHLLLTVIPAEGKTIPPGLEKKILGLQTAVEAKLAAGSLQAPVTVLRGDGDLRKVAENLKVSPGKMAVVLEARENGVEITADEIREERISKAIPQAGGKLPEILKKAEQRKNWSKLLEKYNEETSKPRGKKGQSLAPDSPEGESGSVATPGRKGETGQSGKPRIGVEPAEAPAAPGSIAPPPAAGKAVVKRANKAVQWYANRLGKEIPASRPAGPKKTPGPKSEPGRTGP